MYKIVITILIVAVTILLGYAGWTVYSLFTDSEDDSNEEDNTVVVSDIDPEELEEQRTEIQGNISEEDLTSFQEEGLNPFGHSYQIGELDDTIYQEYIHGMSHQKVIASEKWGFYEIHPERIQWLLDGLEEVELEHENVYRDILEKWAREDFSTADQDHNTIWRLQGGTIGEATGVYSPEEEQAYLNSQTE